MYIFPNPYMFHYFTHDNFHHLFSALKGIFLFLNKIHYNQMKCTDVFLFFWSDLPSLNCYKISICKDIITRKGVLTTHSAPRSQENKPKDVVFLILHWYSLALKKCSRSSVHFKGIYKESAQATSRANFKLILIF